MPQPVVSALWGRYVMGAPLGQGAFGEVASAFDRELGIDVAIKRLSKADPAALFRFKQEFRSLVDLAHPNLVKLHELFCLDDDWYFSMDLIAGKPFSRYVDGGTAATEAATTDDARPGRDLRRAGRSLHAPTAATDARLRAVVSQLAMGLQALHVAHLVHRDLKPSNVLVTDDGRLVILDFGLVAPIAGDPNEPLAAGTPGYMAPEQLAGTPSGAAADWYAVGVMIYEALVGQLPFLEPGDELYAAQLAGARDPRELRADASAELSALCVRLLAPRPEDRPTGAEVLAMLEVDLAAATPTGIVTTGAFIGRTVELAMLRAAREAPRPLVVQLHGASGIGKTALVRRFLDEQDATSTVALELRCHERESLPFKMIDGLVDALTQHLRALPRLAAAALMPRDPYALARLFPVFGRLPSVNAQPRRPDHDAPLEQRRRALVALRELLARLADRHPVVVVIDDLQWSDPDSISVLGELLAEPDPPALLVIAAYRSEDPEASMPLGGLRERLRLLGRNGRELALAELSEADSFALARDRLGADADDAEVRRLVEEAGRHPLLIEELARGRVEHADGPQSLEEVLEARLTARSPDARALLGVLASAGRPLELVVARRVVGLSPMQAHAALAELRAGNLVATVTSPLGTVVEPLHDRIRDAALHAQSAEEIRAHHLAIVEALGELGRHDPEAIADHLLLAGRPDRARPFLLAAASEAVAALAFNRAIELYGQALASTDGSDQLAVQERLANVLSFAGRGRDAARVYAQASESAPPAERLDLQRRAAEQLLRSGNIDEGLAAVSSVLDRAKLRLTRTHAGAVASFLAQRARLKLRGRTFTERTEDQIPPDELALVDVCWTVGMGLSAVDLVRGGEFQTRHLRYALDAGDPYRIALGLALESCVAALDGSEGQLRARGLVTEALALAERVGNPHGIGWAISAAAVLAWSEARFRDAFDLASRGIAQYQAHSIDSVWEVGTLDVWFRLRPLLVLGELDQFVEGVLQNLATAESRQDKFTQALCRTTILPWVHLIADRPADAAAHSQAVIDGWMQGVWHIQHQENLRTHCLVDLYEGRPTQGLARIAEARPRFERAMHQRLQIERFQLCHIGGLLAIAGVRTGAAERAVLKTVARDVRKLRGESNRWADAIAAALEAGIAAARDSAHAPRLYGQAAVAFDGLGMIMHAATARRRRAELAPGAQRDELIAAADLRLTALGIVDPVRFGRLLVA